MSLSILQAAKDKKSELLRLLIQNGADPNERDENGETAFTWAAHLGHTPIVKDLLAAGADQETRGNLFQATPVILAARGGFRGIVALLAVLSDLDAQDEKGATALMRAVEGVDEQVKPPRKILATVKTLIESGASLDVQDQEGYTALMWAVRWENYEVARLLRDAGADKTLRNKRGETAVEIADKLGDVEMVRLLND